VVGPPAYASGTACQALTLTISSPVGASCRPVTHTDLAGCRSGASGDQGCPRAL